MPLNPFAFVADSLWILETWHNCQREVLEHKPTFFFRLETICAKIKWKQKETTTTTTATTKKYMWITNIYSGSSMIASFRYFSKADQCSKTSNCKMGNLKGDGFGKRKLLSTSFCWNLFFVNLKIFSHFTAQAGPTRFSIWNIFRKLRSARLIAKELYMFNLPKAAITQHRNVSLHGGRVNNKLVQTQ